MAYMFRTYDEDTQSPETILTTEQTTTVTEQTTTVVVDGNENVSTLRTQATWLLAGSAGLCFIVPPVGACGVVASLVILAFCPLADKMTDTMSNQIRGGNSQAGGCWFFIIIAAIGIGLVALGVGILTFAELAGRL